MEQEAGGTHLHFVGTRRSDLKKSFKVAVRSLLTSCSREDFKKAFPNFTNAERQRLHQLFIQVVTSLHANIEEEFESLCLETQVGKILDTVEQLVEEQSLDPLYSDKTNIGDVVQNLAKAKENEIQFLRTTLEKAEERMRLVQARIEQLKKGTQEVLGSTDVVEKLRSSISSYQT
ncbi:hypothetical protein SLA2020_524370 [Shorea laevis]